MMVYIMRHGIAENSSDDGDDRSRKLTSRGCEKVRLAAGGMREMGLSCQAIYTSAFARASETAEIVAAELNGAPKPEPLAELEQGRTPVEALDALRNLPPRDSILVVGHEPALSRVASLMLTGSAESAHINLRKGAVIALEFSERIERKTAVLRWMMTQKQLRKLR